jgi:putative transposase
MYAPRKKKDMGAVDPSLPPIPKELLDQLFTGPMAAEAVEAVMRQFKKAFLERALGADGALRIDVPRDRRGAFEPRLIGKHERRFTGADDKIICLYARGMTLREVHAHLSQMYTADACPDLISTVTDAVMAEVSAWQTRPLGRCIQWCFSMRCA